MVSVGAGCRCILKAVEVRHPAHRRRCYYCCARAKHVTPGRPRLRVVQDGRKHAKLTSIGLCFASMAAAARQRALGGFASSCLAACYAWPRCGA